MPHVLCVVIHYYLLPSYPLNVMYIYSLVVRKIILHIQNEDVHVFQQDTANFFSIVCPERNRRLSTVR